MDKKLKKKISITINKEILKKVENLTTNKSRLVEYILLQHLKDNSVDIDDIIL